MRDRRGRARGPGIDILLMPDNKILIDHFLDGAIEAGRRSSAYSRRHHRRIHGHIEPGGIPATATRGALPPFDLGDKWCSRSRTHKIALALKTVGLVNIQFAIKDEVVYVIEANHFIVTVPFTSKSLRRTLRELGDESHARLKLKTSPSPSWTGMPSKSRSSRSISSLTSISHSGPEMKSTGEAIYFIKDLKDPFFRQVYGGDSLLPQSIGAL